MKFEITIRELAELVDGDLRLASMPPLGGGHEPAGRVVGRLSEVRAGDVFATAENQDYSIEEAYARGASGVIVERSPLEPWAGRFAIVVSDAAAAWRKLQAGPGPCRAAPQCRISMGKRFQI